MAHAIDRLYVVQATYSSYTHREDRAYAIADCPQCEGKQMAVLAHTPEGERQWLRCISCGLALAANHGTISPATTPLRTPFGLTGRELDVWQEVRSCLGIGAYTAAVMLCRKLLVHVAVADGLAEKDDKERAPSFAAAVNHMERSGLITQKMRPWIDRIKDVGNEANHELRPISEKQALDVATFTEQLLRLAYEMDAMMDAISSEGQPSE